MDASLRHGSVHTATLEIVLHMLRLEVEKEKKDMSVQYSSGELNTAQTRELLSNWKHREWVRGKVEYSNGRMSFSFPLSVGSKDDFTARLQSKEYIPSMKPRFRPFTAQFLRCQSCYHTYEYEMGELWRGGCPNCGGDLNPCGSGVAR